VATALFGMPGKTRMPRKSIGDRPLTGAERQARQRAKHEAQTALAQEAVRFVLALRPDTPPPRRLVALQRKLEELR
jgi:hypothetical protein